jgi:hypothetical protein
MMKSRMMKCDRARQIRAQPVWAKQAWTKHIGRVAVAGALGLIALAGLAPQAARAQDSDKSLFSTMLKSLGIGGENQIEYRDRPPLVVPPTRDLPPPQTSAAARDPNWPVDPKSGQPRKKGGDQIRDLDKIAVPQRPVEPGIAGSGVSNPSTGGAGAIPATQPAASGGLFGSLFGSSNQPASPTTIPARKSLTQPPPDYESPAPRADSAKSATPEGTQPGASGL